MSPKAIFLAPLSLWSQYTIWKLGMVPFKQMGPSIGGSETMYYYQPWYWTGFSVEILNQLFFTSSFSSSIKGDAISSFKWGKDKKCFFLGVWCYQSMSWCQILHMLHYSHSFSNLTLFIKKEFSSLSKQFTTA